MRLMIAILGLSLASALPASAQPPPQQLTIGLTPDEAEATRLPSYDPAAPIAVTVTEPAGRHAEAVTLVAAGPGGQHLDVALARAGETRFHGVLRLGEPGPWSLVVAARGGSLTTQTNALTLQVVQSPPSAAPWIGFAAGSGIFSLLGSGYFLVCRLARRTRRYET